MVVRVVVRDPKTGAEVPDLEKQDFQLFDNGKPQVISSFSAERPEPSGRAAGENEAAPSTPKISPQVSPAGMPQRFLALFFDDISTSWAELSRSRDAAERYLKASTQPEDRVGIYTASGQGVLDFTDDQGKIEEALHHLNVQKPISSDCAGNISITPYLAYEIADQNDAIATQIIAQEILASGSLGQAKTPAMAEQMLQTAEAMARTCGRHSLEQGEDQSRLIIQSLNQLVRRMGSTPGQRNIVFVSSGFYSQTLMYDLNDVIDHALHLKVTVSSIDARGLPTFIPGGDASQQTTVPVALAGEASRYSATEFETTSDALASLAVGTGGFFFQNNNDLDLGFREAAALPQYAYILAYTPQDLKYDGSFHKITVTLTPQRPFNLQARRGYFAPRKPLDAKQQAEDALQDAVFSADEMQQIPFAVHTEFFKPDSQTARLSVLTHVDIKSIGFQKEQGRNCNELEIVTVLVDRSGNLVAGKQKTLTLRLLDASLERLMQSGITMKTSFDIKPGNYTLREVVRDAQGELSAAISTVEIPN